MWLTMYMRVLAAVGGLDELLKLLSGLLFELEPPVGVRFLAKGNNCINHVTQKNIKR